jgi:hypothetical protein
VRFATKGELTMQSAPSDFRSIEIDFDVHKLIETERLNFSESPNEVLKRILGLKNLKPTSATAQHEKAWSWKGVTLPSGTELRMEYNGKQYSGLVKDGGWQIEGSTFSSPSAAAGAVARTKSGEKTSLDGWIYWNFRRPGETRFTSISSLRR